MKTGYKEWCCLLTMLSIYSKQLHMICTYITAEGIVFYFCFLWCYSPNQTQATSVLWVLNHTHTGMTILY
jgi:hypothetical protein